MLEFKVIGRPQGKERPRINTFTKRAYTTKKTLEYEEQVQEAFRLKYGNIEPLEGAIHALIVAVFEVPKSYSKKRRQEILEKESLYTHRPDGDNIAKAILDSLNGLAFKDDSQVVCLTVIKIYGEESEVIVKLDKL